ncbi:MAG: HD domain-containing phosphohydrolase [Bythopirellula sp.]|nr:HD domain-containing phosphohydrolase [Bythopirellula sp.]
MTIAAVERNADPQVEGYLWIPLAAVRVTNFARVDLFCYAAGDKLPTLLCGGRLDIGPEQIARIESQGFCKVLVRKADLPLVSASVWKSLETILPDNRLTVAERFALLQIAFWEQIEHNSRRLYSDQFVEVARQIGQQIAQLLGESPVLASELYEQSLRDDSRAVHLTNVAGYCVLLAREMGFTDLTELTKIAIGAMLHEFGKLFLPADLLHKVGRLTAQERELLESAPQLGYGKLCEQPDLEFGQLMMVYQQHERFDGSGYPVGVESDEIHPWARVLAVADVFDTMIAKKAYRRENRVAEALLYLADNASQHFDPKAVLCWMTIFQQQ